MRALICLILLLAGCAGMQTTPDFLKAQASTVFLSSGDGLGTGVVINAHCVLTVAHVADEPSIMAVTNSGTPYRLLQKAADEAKDIAVVCGDATLDAPPARLAKEMPDLYAPLYAIGYPLGLDKFLTEGRYQGESMMSVPLAPGNSGGGIWDTHQRLVGLADALLRYDGTIFTHLSVMVTVTDIRAFLDANHIAYQE